MEPSTFGAQLAVISLIKCDWDKCSICAKSANNNNFWVVIVQSKSMILGHFCYVLKGRNNERVNEFKQPLIDNKSLKKVDLIM